MGAGAPRSAGSRQENAHVGAAAQRSASSPPKNAHVGAGARRNAGSPRAVPPAKQTIPPALRRAATLRDQRRCQVPGCSNATWLDVHHIELRSEGGPHSLQNLVSICGAHHRALHRGQLALERSASGVIRVRHADGTEYGQRVHPQRLEIRAKVFSALRQLGFREAQVRAALEQLQQEPAVAQAAFDGLLRAALARLCPAGVQR